MNESRRITDESFVRNTSWPGYEQGRPDLRLVDLFAGCGGLTLGVAEAARSLGRRLDVQLAVDFDAAAVEVYRHNFRKLDARAECAPVEDFFDGPLGAAPTGVERAVLADLGPAPHLLVGGPPCQGHSDLNNYSRRDDPRNAFYTRMARAAEILNPDVTIIENVPSVRHDRDGVVDCTRTALTSAGYRVADTVVALDRLGVPQSRRRHLLLAVRKSLDVDPRQVLADVGDRPALERDVRWAIDDLASLDGSDRGPLDVPSRVMPVNERRIAYLTENDLYELPDSERPDCHKGGGHSYRSVYGRLRWDRPAQTITSGYGSMGQGRYVHPSAPRTLTPHEAARLQSFPDWFDFTANGVVMARTAWAVMIGNAVPPPLGTAVVRSLLGAGWHPA